MNTNIISLYDRPEPKARDVLLHTIASKLNIAKKDIYSAHLKVTSKLMATVADGYILYTTESKTRAAMVVNTTIDGYVFPFIFHTDVGDDLPIGLLYSDASFEYLGSFLDYISSDDHMHYYHSFGPYIPSTLNGIGFIQAIYNALKQEVDYFDDFNIRRIAKLTKLELS